MSYRDDRESLRGRVEALETELAEAREKIARLQGEAPADAADPGSRSFFAAPPPLELERTLPGKLTDAGFEAIADLLQARYPQGKMSQVGRTFSYRHGALEFRIEAAGENATRLRLTRTFIEWRILVPMLAFFAGALPLLTVLRALGPSPIILFLVLPLIVLGAWAGIRAQVNRSVARACKKSRGLFEAAACMAHPFLEQQEERVGDEHASQGVRVGASYLDENEAQTEAVAEAEAEARAAAEAAAQTHSRR